MGLRPTLTFDPYYDPAAAKRQKFLDSLTKLLSIRQAKQIREENREFTIFSNEVSSIRKKGLTVDSQKYFDDPNYRASMKKDEAAFDKIHS